MMTTKNLEAESSTTARLIAARRARIGTRSLLVIAIAAAFQIYSGAFEAACWAAVYIALIVAEVFCFRDVGPTTVLSRTRERDFHAHLLVSTIVFTSFGFLLSTQGNVWGVVCAAIMWSGMVSGAALISGRSRTALLCSLLPPLLAFLAIPPLVIFSGGTIGQSATVAIAGLMNAGATAAVWSRYQRLVTEASEERETNRLAMMDNETGLPNRTVLARRIDQLHGSTTDGIVVVAAISINRFEHLRGAIGHGVMLDLILRLASRLKRSHQNGTICRLSSADIGIVYVAKDMPDAMRIAERLQDASAEPMLLREHRVDVGITVGLSTPDASASAKNLSIIDRAMIAVDQARVARKKVAHFDAKLYGDPGSTLSLMSDMLRALNSGQMSLVYQPKLDLKDRSIRHVEALVRWKHPSRGIQQPEIFVQMAEQTGHIAALTD